MKVNDVVTVVTSLGTEYVGKMKAMDTNGITLADPRLVTPSEKGLGFAAGIAMTGTMNPTQVLINIAQIVFITETNEQVVQAYRKATSGLVV